VCITKLCDSLNPLEFMIDINSILILFTFIILEMFMHYKSLFRLAIVSFACFCTVCLLTLGSVTTIYAQNTTTSLQVIHNAADPAAASVGVWVGLPPAQAGGQPTFLNAVPTFNFRTATPALTALGTAVPSLGGAVGVPLTVNITTPGAAAATPAIASFSPVALSTGANIVFANGVVMPANFAPNPNGVSTAFRLFPVLDTTSAIPATSVRLVVFHGSTDAPRVEVFARGVGVLGTFQYGESFQLTVPLNDYTLDIRLPGTTTVVASFSAPLRNLNLGGQRVIVAASGFLTPSANRNGQPFGLLAVVGNSNPVATALMLPAAPAPVPALPETITSLQVIHNAADPAAASVGVWVGLPAAQAGGQPTFLNAIPTFPFRTATPALTGLGATVPSLAAAIGVPLTVNITAPAAAAATPAIASFTPVALVRGANIVIANGVVMPANFAPNPNGISTAFTLSRINDSLAVPADRVRLIVFHGATDAPRVDIFARGVGVLGTASFREWFTADVPVNDYSIDVRAAGTTTVVASFSAPLRTLGVGGQRVVVSASGFLNPATNRNGSPFGLLAAVGSTAATAVFTMLPSIATSVRQATSNDGFAIQSASPNPSAGQMTVRYAVAQSGTVEMAIINILGVQVLALPSEVRSAGNHTATIDASSLPAGSYQLVMMQNNIRTTMPIIIVR
jgi:hypothetical protein